MCVGGSVSVGEGVYMWGCLSPPLYIFNVKIFQVNGKNKTKFKKEEDIMQSLNKLDDRECV